MRPCLHQTHTFSFFPSSDCSQLPSESSSLSHSHCLRTALCWKKRRMHHLLRPGGGHGHLHLWTHVSVQRLWAETEETDQRMLPNMQEAYQRCYQDISPITVSMFKTGAVTSTAGCHLHPLLRLGWTQILALTGD